jgi:hypothetical protein
MPNYKHILFNFGIIIFGFVPKELDYSLQGNRKNQEGKGHPDRNAQFSYINETVKRFHEEGNPVISVDAKKKELIGNFKNNGKQWRPHGTPEIVNVYDFESW